MQPELARTLERIATSLERMAAALEVGVASSLPDDDPSWEGCPHPDEARVSFGVTNGQVDWQCNACGFRTVTQET